MIKRALVVGAALFFLTSAGWGQDGKFDVSVNMGEALSKTTSGNQIVLGPTQNAAFVGSLAMHLSTATALQLNFGHVDNSQIYAVGVDQFRVITTITEFSGDFVFTPIRKDRYKVFVFGGAGALVFNPTATLIDETSQVIGATRQTRVGVLYGGGADYRLLSRLAFRLQYRGLLYSPPDFGVANLFTGGRGSLGEPTVGFVFNF
jgi:outer membrane immunogenic protein